MFIMVIRVREWVWGTINDFLGTGRRQDRPQVVHSHSCAYARTIKKTTETQDLVRRGTGGQWSHGYSTGMSKAITINHD